MPSYSLSIHELARRMTWSSGAIGIRSAVLSVLLAGGALAAGPAPAADVPPPGATVPGDIDTAKYQAEGVLSRTEFVRSFPGERFYPTMRLEKGAKVTVVGARGDWLKIVPPEGSFSYVNKAFVERYGDGKHGKVTAANLLVKAGSTLQPVMWMNQAKLGVKDTVEILAEDDQYFKIKPPEGAYLYLPKDAVLAPKAAAGEGAKGPDVAPPVPVPPAPTPPGAAAAGPVTTQPLVTEPLTKAGPTPVPAAPATLPTTADGSPPKEEPGTEPADPAAPAAKALMAAEAMPALQSLETQFTAASQKSLGQQPLAELITGYEQVGAAPGLTDSAKRIVEIRLATLHVRVDALDQLKVAQEKQKADQDKLAAGVAEREELEHQLKKVELQRFTAIGTLRVSSLQVAKTTLYRLTDPHGGRTLAYIWGADPKIATMVDQFVGIKGAVQTDPRLQFKVINPAGIEAIDGDRMNTAYAAEIVPPSMLPKTPTATTNTPEQ